MSYKITGETLKLARIIYGFESQERLAEKGEVTLGTIHRYETMSDVDAKTLGFYKEKLNFDLDKIAYQIAEWRYQRGRKNAMNGNTN